MRRIVASGHRAGTGAYQNLRRGRRDYLKWDDGPAKCIDGPHAAYAIARHGGYD